MNEIVISNEDDIYNLLEKLSDESFNCSDYQIDFKNWPALIIKITGYQFNASLTPSIMRTFIELQSSINRSYATIQYGTPNPLKLSKEEKKELELIVKIEQGSSIFNIDIQQLFVNLVEKMDNKETLICILTFILCYFGKSVWCKYLEERKEIRLAEMKNEEQKKLLESQKFLSEQETKRAKIISDIAETNARASTIISLSDDAKAEILKGASYAETFEYQKMEISGDIADELAKNARNSSIDIRLDGLYKILNVDSSGSNEFKVRVRNVHNKEEFVAVIQDNTLDMSNILAIQNGEWQRKLVNMTINAKQRTKNNSIHNAKIIFAEIPSNTAEY